MTDDRDHTTAAPGPYRLGPERSESAGDFVGMYSYERSISDADGADLATVDVAEGSGTARLMAAAPDLMAACRAWDEGFVDGEEFDKWQFLNWVNENRRKAREAIRKATAQ